MNANCTGCPTISDRPTKTPCAQKLDVIDSNPTNRRQNNGGDETFPSPLRHEMASLSPKPLPKTARSMEECCKVHGGLQMGRNEEGMPHWHFLAARNRTATSVLKNTIPVCRRANTSHGALHTHLSE